MTEFPELIQWSGKTGGGQKDRGPLSKFNGRNNDFVLGSIFRNGKAQEFSQFFDNGDAKATLG